MKQQFFILTLICQTLLACKPGPNWVPSTIADQVEAAGIIIDAIVTNRAEEIYQQQIQIKINYAYKTCAPQIITVIGFRSSAACGIDAPLVGERIFIFGNKTENETIIALNEISIHTGMVRWSESIEKDVLAELNQQNSFKCDLSNNGLGN